MPARRAINSFTSAYLTLALALSVVLGCESDTPRVRATESALQGPQGAIKQLCGFVACTRGLDMRNPIVSGVGSADAFFTAALDYEYESMALAATIETALAAINADFDGDIQALAQMHAKGPLRARAGRPRCSVDSSVLLDAEARCDPSLERSRATMHCSGSCTLRSTAAHCDGGDLRCDRVSAGRCSALCRGVCTRPSSATCLGTCDGTCSAGCNAFDANGRCHGQCQGTCKGSCEVAYFDPEDCSGECQGECITEAAASCSDGIGAACVTPGSGASVACDGSCDGTPVAADGLPECMVSATVQAVLRSSCQPAGAWIDAVPAAAPADPVAQARFFTALGNLQRSLPYLLALSARGEHVLAAGMALSGAAQGTKLADSFTAENQGELNTRFAVGLECATAQLTNVASTVSAGSERLSVALNSIAELRANLLVEPAP